MTITLKPRQNLRFPVDGRTISPDFFQGKSKSEIEELKAFCGNREVPLSYLFRIMMDEGSNETILKLSGDLSRVRFIGAGMSTGQVIIEGDVGMHLGEGMKGGSILVNGDAGSWVGSAMKGGRIEVKGNAGDYVGAAYRGSTEGMNGGEIIIHGNVGNETGLFMRNGLIKIGNDVGQFTGVHMVDGTILVQGNSGGRDGAEMKGGKVVVLGQVKSVLPTFTVESVRKTVKVGNEPVQGPFYVFTGDTAEYGQGKLYVATGPNPILKSYDKYL